jgi:predicted nucleotidyltransferase
MDLTTPLSSVIPTLDAHVLTVLSRSQMSLSGRRISQLSAAGSRAGVKLALDRLGKAGVVHAEPAGGAILYRLNRDHILAGGIVAMTGARAELIRRLHDRILTWQVPCRHASMFGSVARGEAGAEGDIAALVVRAESVHPDDQTWMDQLADLEKDVAAWTGNALAWFETNPDGLLLAVARDEPVVQSWRDDGIYLAGDPLATLLSKREAV